MKTALIFFRDFNKVFNAEYYSAMASSFENAGVDIHGLEVLSETDDLCFKRRLEEYKSTIDNLIIFQSERLSFDIKEVIAQVTETVMVENDTAKKLVEVIGQNEGREYPESYSQMPMEATVVPNLNGALQGFIYDDDGFTLALLPMQLEQVKPMCDRYVLPYLENKSGKKSRRIILKYFGEKKALENTLQLAKESFDCAFTVSITENNGDFALHFLFEDQSYSNDVIRFVISELKENIYAEMDTSLSERLFDVLQLRKYKLSTAESFTAGRVMSSIIANPGASSWIHEGITCYSNQSKMDRLGVKQEDLSREGAVSAVVAYQMAAGLLRGGNTDIAIATTGIAGPKSDDTKKPVGLCYIAVGTKNGVHTYRYNFSGNREEITETAKNTALFLAIKLLKNI